MGGIKFCEQCGSPLPPGSKFCENCGAQVAPDAQTERTERGRRQSDSRLRSIAETGRRRTARTPREEEGSRRRPDGVPRESGEERRRSEETLREGEGSRRRNGETRKSETVRSVGEIAWDGETGRHGGRVSQGREHSLSGNMPGSRLGSRAAGALQQQTDSRRRYGMYENAGEQRARRREETDENWQQSWPREMREEERVGMTPVQYVLIGLTAVLLIALIAFGIYWVTRGSSRRDEDSRMQGQTELTEEGLQTEEDQTEDTVTILDQSESQSSVQTERQTESEAADIVLNYQEFTVTLPGSWQGKYGITQGADYFTFYHQGSKAKGYSGTLFTITRYTDTSYQTLPDFQVLGTGNGAAFVFQLPTDVQYAPDEATAQEYQTMAADLNTIKGNIRMLVSGEGPKETEPVEIIQQTDAAAQTQQSGSGYISESSQRAITASDVSGMSYNDLQMAINEIYARHGRKFSDPNIQSYFESQPWYQGTIEADAFDTSVFSSTENQNIQYLLDRMAELQ